MGWMPDLNRIAIATTMQVLNPQNSDIEVAAGIAVQSQWLGPQDFRGFPGTSSSSSGFGWAQVSDNQMAEYGLAGQDQWDPDAAYAAMKKRINLVQDACKGCSARNKLIAAALAQNGSGFTSSNMVAALTNYMGKDGILWEAYFEDAYINEPTDLQAKFRQRLTGKQYSTNFMILLYLQDLGSLYQRGFNLPDGITQEDLDEIIREYTDSTE
jgi:hypothetical protein